MDRSIKLRLIMVLKRCIEQDERLWQNLEQNASLDDLINFALSKGCDIDISVRPTTNPDGQGSLTVRYGKA